MKITLNTEDFYKPKRKGRSITFRIDEDAYVKIQEMKKMGYSGPDIFASCISSIHETVMKEGKDMQ